MLFQLDFASDVPIYQQIRNQIVLGIAQGELKAGEKLPTVRALAQELFQFPQASLSVVGRVGGEEDYLPHLGR